VGDFEVAMSGGFWVAIRADLSHELIGNWQEG